MFSISNEQFNKMSFKDIMPKNEFKQLEKNGTSLTNIKIEPIDTTLSNNYEINETKFPLENNPNTITMVKTEISEYKVCDESIKTSYPDFEMKIVKKESLDGTDEVVEYESLKPNTKEFENISDEISSEAVFIKEEPTTELIKEEHLKVAEEILHNSQEISKQNKKKFTCNECEKLFDYRSCLISHMRSHSGEKPYQCVICEKSFNRKYTLNIHMIRHTGEKNHKCNICGKAYSKRSHLVRHELTHNDKPHVCNDCDKRFAYFNDLILHQRVHTGEKPYSCNACEKAFACLSNLIRHKRIHSGEKPYKCDVCGRLFADKSTLTRHRPVHMR